MGRMCTCWEHIFPPLLFRIVKDPRFERLPCMHSGTYADDCIVNRVTQVREEGTMWAWVQGVKRGP